MDLFRACIRGVRSISGDAASRLEGVGSHSGYVDGAKCLLGVTMSTNAGDGDDGDGVRNERSLCGSACASSCSVVCVGLGARDSVEDRNFA